MSSGQKRIIFNTRERGISDDNNDLQAFAARARAQAQRRMNQRAGTGRAMIDWPVDDGDIDTLSTGGFVTVHDCFGGLLVRPDAPGYLTIDPGSAGFLAPAWPGLTAKDSPYIVVDDEGVQDTGTLTFTANASGDPRCDIVECQPVDTLTTSSNRDVLDPLTGNGVSTLVEKVREAQLTYRIRTGTPNAGVPAIDADWMPLAVVVVQDGASGFDVCDVYDCRPLVRERLDVSNMTLKEDTISPVALNTYHDISATPGSNGSNDEYQIRGYFDTDLGPYKAIGHFWMNCPSTSGFGNTDETGGDAVSFYFENQDNHLVGTAAPGTTDHDLNQIMVIRPRGFGRWIRYSQGAAPAGSNPVRSLEGRLPRGPNGMLVIGQPPSSRADGGCVVNAMPRGIATVQGVDGVQGYGAVVGWTLHDGTQNLPIKCSNRHFSLPIEGSYETFPLDWDIDISPNESTPFGVGLSWTLSVSPSPGLNKSSQPSLFPIQAKKLDFMFRASWLFSASASSLDVGPFYSDWLLSGATQYFEVQPDNPRQFYPSLSASNYTKTWVGALDTNPRNRRDDGGGPSTVYDLQAVVAGTTFDDGGAQKLNAAIVGWTV